MTNFKLNTSLIVITINLIIGNGILYIGGKSSYQSNVNYFLMIGMSIACILIYFLFINFSKFETFSNLKLIITSILSCILIIFIGNSFALVIKGSIKDIFTYIPVMIFMGIMGNIIMFPISLVLGFFNFWLITYLKNNIN